VEAGAVLSARPRAAATLALLALLAPAAALAVPPAASPSSGVPMRASGASPAALRSGASTRASLPAIERRVMCVTCKIPLIVADSPQADRERAYIEGLIEEGETTAQIERALVSQYGPAVLGLPSAHGFDLTVYAVPLAVVLALTMTLALLLPRWRRRGRGAQTSESAPGGEASVATPPLSDADAARLDADLARFER
jgi:cytochrome c-type biogenesis protein CcmH